MLLQKLYMLYVAPYICCCVLTLCIQMLVTRIRDSLRLFREREAERHAERFQTLINLVTAPSIPQWQVANDGRDTLYCGDEPGTFTVLGRFSRRDSVWDCSRPPSIAAHIGIDLDFNDVIVPQPGQPLGKQRHLVR